MNSDITDDEDFGGSGSEGSGEYGSGTASCDPFDTKFESGSEVITREVSFAGLSIVTWVRDSIDLSMTLFMFWLL